MKWATRVVAVLLAALVLLVLAGLFGPNLIRQRVALAAQRALHRDVAIGDLRLLPSWPPTLQASDVTVTGLGTAAGVQARLAPAALFGGRIVVEQVHLLRPSLMLAPDAQGRVSLLGPAPATQPNPATAPASGTSHHVQVSVQHVAIQDGTLVWSDKRIGPPLTLAVSGTRDGDSYDLTLHGTVPAGTPYPWLAGCIAAVRVISGQPVRATLTGNVRGQPVQVAVETGTPEAIAAGGRLPLTATATAAGATLRATGSVGSARALSGLDLAVSVRAGDEARLAALAGWPRAAAGPVSLDAHVIGGPSRFDLHGLALAVPQGEVSGDIALALGARPSLSGALRSRRLDLDAVLAALAARPAPASAVPAVPSPPPVRFADRPLPFAALARADADLTFQAASLRFAGEDYRALTGHLVLLGGRLALDPFAAVLPGGAHLEANAHLDGIAAPPTAALVLHAPAVAVAPLLAALHLPAAATGTTVLAADLHGAGATPHALAASLGGTASLRMADGTIEGGMLGAVLGAAHLPIRLDAGHVGLRCLALGFTAQHGVLTMAPLVVDAGRVLVQGSGTVDLGRETLGLHLRPLLRTGPGLVVPVQVTGPWRAPKLTSDAAGASLAAPAGDACRAAGVAVPASAPSVPKKLPNSAELLRKLFR